MMGLTRMQSECLRVIQDVQERTGTSPSYVEIAAALGLNSKSGVHRLVTALEERGFIRRLPKLARAVELIHEQQPCPHCGHLAGSTLCRAAAQGKWANSFSPAPRTRARHVPEDAPGAERPPVALGDSLSTTRPA